MVILSQLRKLSFDLGTLLLFSPPITLSLFLPFSFSSFFHLRVCVCVRTCLQKDGGQRTILSFLTHQPPCFLRQCLSLDWRLLSKPRDLPVSTSPAVGWQVCTTAADYLWRSGYLLMSFCFQVSLLTDLSPQYYSSSFYDGPSAKTWHILSLWPKLSLERHTSDHSYPGQSTVGQNLFGSPAFCMRPDWRP